MNTYNEFLSKVIDFQKGANLSNKKDKVLFNILKTIYKTLLISIKYQKMKKTHDFKIDFLEEDLLENFFGDSDIKEAEKKLKEIRKIFKEIKEA